MIIQYDHAHEYIGFVVWHADSGEVVPPPRLGGLLLSDALKGSATLTDSLKGSATLTEYP